MLDIRALVPEKSSQKTHGGGKSEFFNERVERGKGEDADRNREKQKFGKIKFRGTNRAFADCHQAYSCESLNERAQSSGQKRGYGIGGCPAERQDDFSHKNLLVWN